MFWVMHTGIIAAVAMILARYVGFFVPVGDVGLKVLAVGAVITLSAVNYLGVRQGSLVQTTLTIIKVGAVVGLTAIAFAMERDWQYVAITTFVFAMLLLGFAIGRGSSHGGG